MVGKYIRYGIVGATGFFINILVFEIVLTALSPALSSNPAVNLLDTTVATASQRYGDIPVLVAASVSAFIVSTFWSFLLNSLWTFRSRRGHRHRFLGRLGLYYLVSLGALGVNELILIILSPYAAILFAQAIGVLLGSIVGFLGNNRFTFRELPAPVIPPGALASPTER